MGQGTELWGEHATVLVKGELCIISSTSVCDLHFCFFQPLQSHRCPAASLRYTLLLEAVRAAVLGQGTLFYLSACKGKRVWGEGSLCKLGFQKADMYVSECKL